MSVRLFIFVAFLGLNVGILLWQIVFQKSEKLTENSVSSLPFEIGSNKVQMPQNNINSSYYTVLKNTSITSFSLLQSNYIDNTRRTPKEDITKLIDLIDFEYLLRLPHCIAGVEALILVHSAPRNREKRAAIRNTWGGRSVLKDKPLRLIFLLGAVTDAKLQRDLELEYKEQKDLVQGSFVDHYRNITYKHVMGFKWFLHHCTQAQILIKVDDDVFVNTPQLLQYWTRMQQNFTDQSRAEFYGAQNNSSFNASNLLLNKPRNLLFCQRNVNANVKRSYRSKWRVSFEEYRAKYYPPYCPGYAIIYSVDVVTRLFSAAQHHKYFWIDDVHITGILAQQIHIEITPSKSYILSSSDQKRILNSEINFTEVEFIFSEHSITQQEIYTIWSLYLRSTINPPNSSLSFRFTHYNETFS